MGSIARSYKTVLSTGSSRGSHHSGYSYGSTSTVPSSISDSQSPPKYSSPYVDEDAKHYNASYDASILSGSRYHPISITQTVASVSDLCAEPEEYDESDTFEFDIPDDATADSQIETRTTTPEDFPYYFPSQREFCIRHDNTVEDGNMNLRVDIADSRDGKVQVELFYLRMRDIQARDFSLRRYCRDSGREICHSTRRCAKPAAAQRPNLQRSMSVALASLRPKPHAKRTTSSISTKSMPTRQDSGYASNDDEDLSDSDNDNDDFDGVEGGSGTRAVLPDNIIKLEFSNYAQVLVKRRGNKLSKRYEFEYWGTNYRWKRIVNKSNLVKTVEFHLVNEQSGKTIASIIPEERTPAQVITEEMKGGWVPPCSLRIIDPKYALAGASDVAEVIVATGLTALVEDSIEHHLLLKTKNAKQLALPLTPLKMDMEYVGPKAIVSHMFRRRGSSGSTIENLRDSRESRQSPLRFAKHVEAY